MDKKERRNYLRALGLNAILLLAMIKIQLSPMLMTIATNIGQITVLVIAVITVIVLVTLVVSTVWDYIELPKLEKERPNQEHN